MNFIEATKSGVVRAFDFKTRSSRSEFWYFNLALALVGFFIGFIELSLGLISQLDENGPLYTIYMIAALIPSISVAARRLHDRSLSGWNQLWVITIIGIIPILILMMLPAKEDENKWGKNPLI